jgi:hypothetical protein
MNSCKGLPTPAELADFLSKLEFAMIAGLALGLAGVGVLAYIDRKPTAHRS